METVPPDSSVRAGLPSISGLERDAACPGNRLLSAGLEGKQHSWTRDGTTVDAVLAGEQDPSSIEDNADLVYSVERCAEIERKVVAERGFADAEIIVIKERIWIHYADGTLAGSGEIDKAWIKNGVALIIDFKNGHKQVIAPHKNLQLIGYACLLRREYGIKHAELKIIGPWQKNQGIGEMTEEEMIAWDGRILEIWQGVKIENAPRHAGKWCDYCPARGICPEARQPLAELTGASIATQRYELLSPSEKLELWDVVAQVEKTAKEIKEKFRSDLDQDPEAIPGLKLKEGAETIMVPVSEEFWNIELRHVMSHEQFLKTVGTLSLSSIAEELAGKTKKDQEKKKAELRARWEQHLKISRKKGSIARV